MKNVKQLSFFFVTADSADESIEKKNFEDIVTFAKDRGFLPVENIISFAPSFVEFELQQEISVNEALNLVSEFELTKKYEVTEFRFCTEAGSFYGDEDPYAGIYLLKK